MCFFKKKMALPIDTTFSLPSSLPSWPSGEGFATGGINLGGLEVRQVSTFIKVWSVHEGGPDNLGATIFKPSDVPDGFFNLGYYCQPNNKPLHGWVLVGGSRDEDEILVKPVDYILVWSSESLQIKQDNAAYIWLPKPPEGYKALGYVVTDSANKPSFEEIRCVRFDFTDTVENENSMLEIKNHGNLNIYSSRPSSRGTQSQGISVGTFLVQVEGDASSSSTLACLKNKDFKLSYMPNQTQIQVLLHTYSPIIYFHSKEKYYPSSLSWFFNNGALLYKQGESMPIRIDATGSNLPQGGDNDGTYWIDLPVDDIEKEKVKRGDLKSCKTYLHVKPMLGATFTDIVIWVFYPFNGPATAKVKFINLPLGKTGQHIGDWEHLTLRVSNFTGELWKVYYSQHSSGSFLDSSEVEFEGGNKVVAYASCNGHAFYPKPGLVLQGDQKLGVGIRNDSEKSSISIDTAANSELISADYLNSVIEPPWLDYRREWGPKISYKIEKELENVKKLLPWVFKSIFEKVLKSLPRETLGEEGPTGPKMKGNWTGDEV